MEAAQRGTTLLRAPSGDALAFLPHVELERLANIRDYARGFVMLESALRRPRNERRAADFGLFVPERGVSVDLMAGVSVG